LRRVSGAFFVLAHPCLLSGSSRPTREKVSLGRRGHISVVGTSYSNQHEIPRVCVSEVEVLKGHLRLFLTSLLLLWNSRKACGSVLCRYCCTRIDINYCRGQQSGLILICRRDRAEQCRNGRGNHTSRSSGWLTSRVSCLLAAHTRRWRKSLPKSLRMVLYF
jgi:hypothetical protein